MMYEGSGGWPVIRASRVWQSGEAVSPDPEKHPNRSRSTGTLEGAARGGAARGRRARPGLAELPRRIDTGFR